MHSPLTQFLKGERGKQKEIADALKIDRITLYRWARNGIPAERVIEIERVTGIPRKNLRPDLYVGAA
jgi:DNA-binding transcriptional regulator YdaS (Cro superfamily)